MRCQRITSHFIYVVLSSRWKANASCWGSHVIIPKSLQGDILKEWCMQHTRWYIPDKETSKKLCMVAQFGQPDRGPCQRMHPLPEQLWLSSFCSPEPTELACQTLAVDPYWFCRLFLRKNVLGGWCQLQMARVIWDGTGNCNSHHCCIASALCPVQPYGLPNQLVSDNGLQFTPEEFWKFLKTKGVQHV